MYIPICNTNANFLALENPEINVIKNKIAGVQFSSCKRKHAHLVGFC